MGKLKNHSLLFLLLLVLIASCGEESVVETKVQLPLFTSLPASETGIDFVNQIEEDFDLNILKFDYMYNGGGVATGDLNGDGLPELVFTGNMTENKIYRNNGGCKFEDVTSGTGMAAAERWSTGVSMIDVNTDGLLDIYICCSGTGLGNRLTRNMLFINQGNFQFVEQAVNFGLADPGNSIQASWFDYDLDGDVDVFVANHPGEFDLPKDQRLQEWKSPKLSKSNRLYRNTGRGYFEDVTELAGVASYDYTLGLVTGDINGDGYPDIYLSNDYIEPDRFYVNNKDGTFTESLELHFRHTSNFGMGADLADMNNDAMNDLVSVDMVAKDNFRQKTQMSSMNPEAFWGAVEAGYQWQYMRNSLQLNQGGGLFSEIAQMSGVAYTDWSWAPLFADFDQDGWKDLVVTNGFRRDSRNADKRKELKKLNEHRESVSPEEAMAYLNSVPSTRIKNYFFKNNGDFTFEDLSDSAGIGIPSFSNGAVYSDLDGDGDLDLVVNNLLDPAFVLRNNTAQNGGSHWLKVKFSGPAGNPLGIGTKVLIKIGESVQYREMLMTRGYQSSMEPLLHFGLGNKTKIDAIQVWWNDGRTEILRNVSVDKVLTLEHSNADFSKEQIKSEDYRQLFAFLGEGQGCDFTHVENNFDDYEKQVLLPHKMSQFGPALATGDVNSDGFDDVFVGGALGQSGGLFLQDAEGFFSGPVNGAWTTDRSQEDVGATFFDADGDSDLDLYVVSGGNEFPIGSPSYQDRLYMNDGKGNFSKSSGILPELFGSGSRVTAADYDYDGDVDLFVGGRHVPGNYPFPAGSILLENQGATFLDVTATMAPELTSAGMVTDALWTDFSGDKKLDLIVVGEWTGIIMLKNAGGMFKNVSAEYGIEKTSGWWFSIAEGDFNSDGKNDYVLGNLGKNYKYQATATEPFQVYAGDFDENGNSDIILGYFNGGVCYPVRGRQCSSQQLPDVANKFPSYEEFGKASLEDVYGENLSGALNLQVTSFASSILLSKANGFDLKELPIEAQVAPVNGIVVGDFDDDGNQDMVIAGNLFVSEVETGRADAGLGFYLQGDGKGEFEVLPPAKMGFFVGGDVKDLALARGPGGIAAIIVASNNDLVQSFRCLVGN